MHNHSVKTLQFCSDIRKFVPSVPGQHQLFHLWLLMPRAQMPLLTRCSTRLLFWNFSGSVWSRHWLVWDFDGRTSTGSFDEVDCYFIHGHIVCQITTRYQTLFIWSAVWTGSWTVKTCKLWHCLRFFSVLALIFCRELHDSCKKCESGF